MRIQSFNEFWPYYLSQHSTLLCRILHFIGTTFFLLTILICFLLNGVNTLIGLGLSIAILYGSAAIEPKRNPMPVLLLVVGLMAWSDLWVLIGIVTAYFFAWISHFSIEKNRPATFQYPVWSIAGDMRLWCGMCIGKYWRKNISDHWNKSQHP